RKPEKKRSRAPETERDPGFSLKIIGDQSSDEDADVSAEVLGSFVFRAVLEVQDNRLNLDVFRRESEEAQISVSEQLQNLVGSVYADIRFFPQRSGTFRDLSVDGRLAKSWVRQNSGVAVFDRTFRM